MLLAISLLLAMVKVPALTITFPAFPVLFVTASDAMPVKPPPGVPVIVNGPVTLTETLPPFPGPNVLLPIWPLLAIDKVPALTETLPPLPGPELLAAMKPLLRIDIDPAATTIVPAAPLLGELACEKIPPEPLIVSWSDTATLMVPALPEANVSPEIWPPLVMLKDPALTTIVPAAPLLA